MAAIVFAHSGKLEWERLGFGSPALCHSLTIAQSADKMLVRLSRITDASRYFLNWRSSARSTSRNNSQNKERRRISGDTVQPFPVTNTMTLLSPRKVACPPRMRPLQSCDVRNQMGKASGKEK